MAQEQTITGVRGLTTKTWYPRPPIEWGRAGGAVATIGLGTATGDNGTSGAGSNCGTASENGCQTFDLHVGNLGFMTPVGYIGAGT